MTRYYLADAILWWVNLSWLAFGVVLGVATLLRESRGSRFQRGGDVAPEHQSPPLGVG